MESPAVLLVHLHLDGTLTEGDMGWLNFTGQSHYKSLSNWQSYIHPDDFLKAQASYQSAQANHQPFTVEARLKRLDGFYRWFSLTGVKQPNNSFQVNKYLLTWVDIHQYKQMEEYQRFLQRFNARLANTTQQAQVGVAVSEVKEIFEANTAALLIPNAEENRLNFITAHNLQAAAIQRYHEIPLDRTTIAGDAYLSGQPIWISNLADYREVYPNYAEAALQNQTQAVACIPLRVNTQIAGVLGIGFATTQFFDESQRRYLEAFAQLCEQALTRAQMYEAETKIREELEKRNRWLSQIKTLTDALAQSLTIRDVTKNVVDVGMHILGARTGAFHLLVENSSTFEMVYVRGGQLSKTEQARWRRFPAISQLPVTQVALTKQPLWFTSGEEMCQQYPQMAPLTQVHPGASALVPVISDNNVLGVIAFSFMEQHTFTAEEQNLILAITQQCAQVIYRVNLYEAEREQSLLAQALQQVALTVSNSLDLSEVLDDILASIGKVVPHDAAKIILIDDVGTRTLKCKGYQEHGLEAFEAILSNSPNLLDRLTRLHQIYGTHAPLLISDTRHDLHWLDIPEAALIQSFVGVPILNQEQVIGFIGLDSLTPNFFTEKHLLRLQAFAAQTATAIQNAQLYQQAQALAALEERQRLARELHDAVSQTLFSATTIAEALPRLWERNPERTKQRLQQVVTLNQAAMAEMRTLLLELRPETVLKTEMSMLLKQLVAAAQGKKNITGEVAVENISLPPDVHVAFYRIAQESINNILKHSHASKFVVQLKNEANHVELSIRDNGQGFNMATLSPGLGLGTMRERAAAIGATWEIESGLHTGTIVRVTWNKTHRSQVAQ